MLILVKSGIWKKAKAVLGIEIKQDKKFSETGNLYIEMYEKTSPEKPLYAKSGILREDNTVFYFIGDYARAWLFSKNQLRSLCLNYEKNGFKKVITSTSIGILIPVSYIEEHQAIPIMNFYF